MKHADKPKVVINITGDNNKVFLGGKPSHPLAIAASILAAAAVLAVSLCCPDLLADFVRLIISMALGN